MSLPTGTFNHEQSGRLEVNFTAPPTVDGAPYAGGGWNLRLRCYVDDGVDRLTTVIGFDGGTAVIEIDYLGGTDVEVGMEAVDHAFDGAGTVSAAPLIVTCRLWRDVVDLAQVTFEGLLAYLSAQLQPMSGTVQTEPGHDDITGTDHYVRPLGPRPAAITDSPSGTLDGTGMAIITVDADSAIESVSLSEYQLPFDGGWVSLPYSIAGNQLTLGPGGIAAPYRVTYTHRAIRDGSTYGRAWGRFVDIDWGGVAPGDSVWVCGTFTDEQLTLDGVAGTAGAWVKIRLDHATDPGRIFDGPVISPTAWVAAGDGEYYLTGYVTSNNMVFEDGVRLVGPSTTSLCKQRVQAINVAASTVSIGGERPLYTGMPIWIPADFPAGRLPAGLQFSADVGAPYYVIVTALVGTVYTFQFAAGAAAAIAGTPIALGTAGDGGNWFVWVVDSTHADPLPGALLPGRFGYDVVQQRLYYRPSSGTPADHEVRVSSDKAAATGVCIYGLGCSYLRVLGGGQYGGLFADAAAPRGQVGLAHLNAIQFEGPGSHVIVDGVEVFGSRSGVAFRGVTDCVSRNNRIRDVGWHATGGERVTDAEPRLLQERNWLSDIGLKHDFGDVQGLVTNPGCDDSVFRRNFVQRCGRDSQYANTGAAVVDSSAGVQVYRNWFDQCEGEVVECGSGADGDVVDPVVLANVVTRSGTRSARVRENARQCFVGCFVAGAYGITGALVAGNLVANGRYLISQVFPNETAGVLQLRSASTASVNEGHSFTRNAVFNVEGHVYAVKVLGATTPVPAFDADENLFATLNAFYAADLAVGTDVQYDDDHIQGDEAGYWSFDTGSDVGSLIAEADRRDFRTAPTAEQLEILRQGDEYDTLDVPTVAMVGDFPLGLL